MNVTIDCTVFLVMTSVIMRLLPKWDSAHTFGRLAYAIVKVMYY